MLKTLKEKIAQLWWRIVTPSIDTHTQWWIDKNKLLGSRNPTTDTLKELYKKGFRTVISLLGEKETPNYDINQVREYIRISIPIEDFTAPTQNQYTQFQNDVTSLLKRGKIIMHCQGGSGRTGTMGAAYWINKGFSAEEAIREIRKRNSSAIETVPQGESLKAWEVTCITKTHPWYISLLKKIINSL